MCVTEAGLRASYCLETSDLFTDLRNIKLRLSCFNREKETAVTRERDRGIERENGTKREGEGDYMSYIYIS